MLYYIRKRERASAAIVISISNSTSLWRKEETRLFCYQNFRRKLLCIFVCHTMEVCANRTIISASWFLNLTHLISFRSIIYLQLFKLFMLLCMLNQKDSQSSLKVSQPTNACCSHSYQPQYLFLSIFSFHHQQQQQQHKEE